MAIGERKSQQKPKKKRKGLLRTFVDTQTGKTTRDKVAEAEARAMGKRKKK